MEREQTLFAHSKTYLPTARCPFILYLIFLALFVLEEPVLVTNLVVEVDRVLGLGGPCNSPPRFYLSGVPCVVAPVVSRILRLPQPFLQRRTERRMHTCISPYGLMPDPPRSRPDHSICIASASAPARSHPANEQDEDATGLFRPR